MTLFDFLQCVFSILATLLISCIVIPWILLMLPIVAVSFWYLRRYFVATSRQIKRLEATSRSPVYSQFSSTLDGLSQLRSYKVQDLFMDKFTVLQNTNTRIYFAFFVTSRWLGIRLDLLSSCFVIVIAFLSVGFKESFASVGLIGLVLSYALQLLGLVQWCVRQSAEGTFLFLNT